MGAILDIILSLVIRGAIAIAILNMTISLQGKLSEKTAQANMFNLTAVVSRVVAYDCNLTGYNVSSPFFTSAKIDTMELTYYDPSTLGQVWIKYFAGDTSEMSGSRNPRDKKLYRIRSTAGPGTGARTVAAVGLDSLRFDYFDQSGSATSTLTSIKSFTVYLVMASGEKVNGIYPAAEWNYRFFPSNIN